LFWKNLAQGDLGRSYFSGKSVQELVAERLPYTLLLAFCAMIWAFIIALPLGVMAALHRNRWLDRLLLTTSLIGISLPVFYTGPLLVLVFSLGLDLLPTSGVRSWNSWILPSLTLGIAFAALLIRMTRASVLDVLHRDFIRTARAKGLSSWVVLARHVVRASLIPVVSIMGLQFGALLAGAVVTEKIYSWPGMGTLMLEAISRRDYGVVQGCVVVISVCYVGVNFMIDLVYARLDPRIRLDG
jgi:peptide/nickel transport system permease protein